MKMMMRSRLLPPSAAGFGVTEIRKWDWEIRMVAPVRVLPWTPAGMLVSQVQEGISAVPELLKSRSPVVVSQQELPL